MLSNSNFIIAQTCATKLYYATNKYPKNTDTNEYMAMLAEGGYMVSKLAQLLYPEGIEVKTENGSSYAVKETEELLSSHENITLFDAGISINNKMIRIDILRKIGNTLEIIEVKSKSIDSRIDPKKNKVKKSLKNNEYKEYLQDVAFQKLVVQEKYPLSNVSAFMLMPDKIFLSPLDNILTWFKLVKTVPKPDTTFQKIEVEFIGNDQNLKDLRNKENQLLALIPVDEIIENWLPNLKAKAESYIESIISNTKIHSPPISKCRHCEFKVEANVEKNGFLECWGELALRENPFILDLVKLGNVNQRDNIINYFIAQGKKEVEEGPIDEITKSYEIYSSTYNPLIKKQEFLLEELLEEIQNSNVKYPLHFIDFETSQMALPYHKNMRCSEKVIFQWSCHTIEAPNAKPKHYEWINMDSLYPNLDFANQLRNCIGNEGSVMIWSEYQINQLQSIFTSMLEIQDFDLTLRKWLEGLIIQDQNDSFNRMIDMHDWANELYFQNKRGDYKSIKLVLPAVLKSNKSFQVQELLNDVGLFKKDSEGNTINPYDVLPEVAIEFDGQKIKVKDRSGAMRAYQDMVYGLNRDNNEVKNKYKQVLLDYCRLDTLAMVIIWEHWMQLLRK